MSDYRILGYRSPCVARRYEAVYTGTEPVVDVEVCYRIVPDGPRGLTRQQAERFAARTGKEVARDL